LLFRPYSPSSGPGDCLQMVRPWQPSL
jgi:hypothetical protein